MRKGLAWALALALTAMVPGFAAAGGPPIRVGNLPAVTGSGATWGICHRDSSILAVEEFNAQGGVDGRKVEFFWYDTKCKAEDAVNGLRRLIEKDKVTAVTGTVDSGIQLAIVPIGERAKVPLMGIACTNPTVTVNPKTGKVRPYSFRICFTDPYLAKCVAELAFKEMGKKTATVFYDVGSAYAEGMKAFFVERFSKLGGNVLNTQGYRDGDVDFRAQISAAKASGAQVCFLPGNYKEMALIIKQSHELGWKPAFIGGDGYSPNMYEIAGPAMEGTYWCSPIDFHDPKLMPLFRRYEKRFGAYPVEPGSVAHAYDAMWCLLQAMKKAQKDFGRVDGDTIAKTLENTRNLKLEHFVYTCNPKTHDPVKKPVVILKIQNKTEKVHSSVIAEE